MVAPPEPGSGAISRSAVDVLLQMCSGVLNVPARQTTVGAVMASWWAAIQAFTAADVVPLAGAVNVTAQDPWAGGPTGDPSGVCGFGMRPSPSAGAWPAGSTGNDAARTGGVGWLMVAGLPVTAALAAGVSPRAVSTAAAVTPRAAQRRGGGGPGGGRCRRFIGALPVRERSAGQRGNGTRRCGCRRSL